jgi:quercetin dioxygenase-like cupin family protein
MKQVCKASEYDYLNVLEGIKRKTLVFGSNSLMTEFRLEKGKNLPQHRHSNEQTGYLISGHIILNIDGQNFEMHAGDSWCIPGDTEHGAEIIENSIAIEVFCPVREDYLLGRLP